MQDRYVGDIGDFAKYGLLRAIRNGRRLGVAWYLHPDQGPEGDGGHIQYLSRPGEFEKLDPGRCSLSCNRSAAVAAVRR